MLFKPSVSCFVAARTLMALPGEVGLDVFQRPVPGFWNAGDECGDGEHGVAEEHALTSDQRTAQSVQDLVGDRGGHDSPAFGAAA